jgi:DNA modification methylase
VLIRADARKIPLGDESVHCVATSPPFYGLRDYGISGQIGLEPTPAAYVAELVAVFREVWRVLRDDGVCWVNLGDSYAASANTEGSAKRRGAMNGHTRAIPPGLKPKDLIGIPWRVAFALQADGWYLRSDVIWAKPNPMPESVTDRPTKAHEYVFLLTKSARYFWDQEAVREPDSGQQHHRNVFDGQPSLEPSGGLRSAHSGIRVCGVPESNGSGRNVRSVWTIPTQPYSGAHFATWPEALVKRCILAGCPVSGIVLDPFVGSGTTVKVARRLGRHGIGLDLSAAYLNLAQERLDAPETAEGRERVELERQGQGRLPL